MAYQVGYWTELSSIKLDESDMTSTFQAFPYGKYDHPVYGEIEFTPEKADEAVRNFNSNVRGTELDIDYDHKARTGEAAGWVKGAEKRSNGLYLTVEWTKDAWDKIQNKAYKYFSPEFADEWKHPKTGILHKNLLFGGAITNRPFLKDILPLNMSELFAEQQKEGSGMDPKKLRKLLGLPEDATDEQVNEAMSKVPDDHVIGAPPKEENEPEDKNKANETEPNEQTIAASEVLPQEVIQLAESNPAVKALADLVVGLQQTVQTQGVALQLAETNAKVTRLSEPVDGKRALPTAAQEALRKVLLKSNKELSDDIVSFVETLNKTGYVELGERATSHDLDSANDDALKKFDDAVQKIITNDKLSYADAAERVASLNPQLYAEYQQASYAFKE